MPSYLESVPDKILDDLTRRVLALSPSLRISFLASLGPRLRSSTIRVLFHSLHVLDDCRALASQVAAVISNPARYAPEVRSLRIQDAGFLNGVRTNSIDKDLLQPLDSEVLFTLLKFCSNLEEFFWESSIPPPDGLCEALNSHNHLSRFSYAPFSPWSARNYPTRNSMPKWNALSLPLLSNLPITVLALNRLSQSGARALSALLSSMNEYSFLEDVSIDFVWLDDTLCERIVEAGRRLRRLKIGTTGTKLTDRGICAIVEGCDALEDLTLDEVQGRLSRSLWSKPSHYPAGLKRFTAAISEMGPHHSWTTDHLVSLGSLPMRSLDALYVVRKEQVPRLESGVPVYDSVADDVVALKFVPRDFVERIVDAKALSVFECDWWAWSIADVKMLLESCPNLTTLKLCLDVPFSKLLNLTSSLANLRTISVCINPIHAPGKPPTPQVPVSGHHLPTPTESPVMRSKSALPQLLDIDQMQTHPCLNTNAMGDPSMPLLRDVKRFVRKCTKLETLHWYGTEGRGSWSIARPVQASKNSLSISVDYSPPTISMEVWEAMVSEQEKEKILEAGLGPVFPERVGQAWTSKVAEALAGAEKERVETASPKERDRTGFLRDDSKKVKPSSISTSWPSNTSMPSPGSASSIGVATQSPTEQSFSQLTPPNSDGSLSTALLPLPEESWSQDDTIDPHSIVSRNRTPSEPGLNHSGRVNGRSRSASSLPSGDSGNASAFRTAASATSKGGAKAGRGKSGNSGKSDKLNGTPSASRNGVAHVRVRGRRVHPPQ